jgi:Ca2+-binding EF-hand superfamily protein
MTFIASTMIDREENDRIKMCFQELDENGDGVLTPDEIRSKFRDVMDVTCSNEDIEELITAADIDGDGVISLDEFV